MTTKPHRMEPPKGQPKLPPRFAQKAPARPETNIANTPKPKIGGGHFKK